MDRRDQFRFVLATLAWFLAACAGANAARGATFRGLGDLPGGIIFSGANGISADGCTVVGVAVSTSGSEAFRWTAAGGMAGLGDLPGGSYSSGAWNVSADGRAIVGTSSATAGMEAFRWTQQTGIVSLGDLPDGDQFAVAHGVSADGGTVVGYGRSHAGQEAFVWTAAGGMRPLNDFAGGDQYSAAAGISSDARTIVGFGSSDTGIEAARWNAAGSVSGLGELPGGVYFSGANGVSGDGAVVVGVDYSNLPGEAFIWSAEAGMTGLGLLPGASAGDTSQAYDVSVLGRIVVGYASVPTAGNVAVIWDEAHGMRRLDHVLAAMGVNVQGWRLTEATAISDNGQVIVGRGYNPGGFAEAWMATVPPLFTTTTMGDATGDGTAGRADVARLIANLGQPCGASYYDGDFNSDGAVSLADLMLLQDSLNRPTAASPVPEPSAAAITISGACLLIGAFRRRRSSLGRYNWRR